jgi:NifU-like protein involved in Fe-S cluster formation
MYSPQVAERIANPRNVGELVSPSGTGDVTNQVCLDRIKLTIQIDGHQLTDAKVQARGCPPTIAAASAITELIIGRTVSDVCQLTRRDILTTLGRLPAAKMHCAALAIEALRAALEDARALNS